MDLSPLQQAVDLIRKSKRVGILIPEEADLDQFVSAKILGRTLDFIEKSYDFIFPPAVKEEWKFLPPDSLKPHQAKKDIIISVNTSDAPIGEIRYEKKDRKLEIIISPKSRQIKKEDIFVAETGAPFDLLVTIGVGSLDKLGERLKNPNLIFDTPLINIDHDAGNENFGEVNIVEKEALANAEIIFNLIKKISPKPLESGSATMILAGIAYKIKQSKTDPTQGVSLMISELKERGGDWDLINKNLREQKPLNLLKLWGRASVRSKKEDEKNIFWSFITAEDFEKTSTGPENVKFVLDHFEEHFSLPEASVLLWQNPESKFVHAILRLENNGFLNKIAGLYGEKASGKLINFKSSFADFREAETKIRALLAEDI